MPCVHASQDGDLQQLAGLVTKMCSRRCYILGAGGINRTCEISDGTACSMRVFVDHLYVFMREW
jgi:hypothetical protein